MEKKTTILGVQRSVILMCTMRVIFRLYLIKVYGVQIRDQQASRIKKCSVFQFVRSVQKKIKFGLKLDPLN